MAYGVGERFASRHGCPRIVFLEAATSDRLEAMLEARPQVVSGGNPARDGVERRRVAA